MIYSYIPYYQPILASLNKDMNSIFRIESLFAAGYIKDLYKSNYYKSLILPDDFFSQENISWYKRVIKFISPKTNIINNKKYYDYIKKIYMYKIAADFVIMRPEFLHNFKFLADKKGHMMSFAAAYGNIDLVKYSTKKYHFMYKVKQKIEGLEESYDIKYLNVFDGKCDVDFTTMIREFSIGDNSTYMKIIDGDELSLNDVCAGDLYSRKSIEELEINPLIYAAYNDSDEIFKFICEDYVGRGGQSIQYYSKDFKFKIFENLVKFKRVSLMKYWIDNGFELNECYFSSMRLFKAAGNTEICRFLINNCLSFRTKDFVDAVAAEPKKYDYFIPIVKDILANLILSLNHHGNSSLIDEFNKYEESLISLCVFENEIGKVNEFKRSVALL